MSRFERVLWILLAYAWIVASPSTRLPGKAQAEGAVAASQQTLGVSYHFDNGDKIGDRFNGYMCLSADLNQTPKAGTGKETLTVIVRNNQGQPAAGIEVRVKITAGLLFWHFKGKATKTLQVDQTDAAGEAKFEFEGAAQLGVAELEIQVPDAGLTATAQGSSFILIPQLLSATNVPFASALPAGSPAPGVENHGPHPAAEVLDRMEAGGAIGSLSVTSSDSTAVSQTGGVNSTLAFKIVATPEEGITERIQGMTTGVADFQLFFHYNQGGLSASITAKGEGAHASAGYNLHVVTTNITGGGLEADYFFPGPGAGPTVGIEAPSKYPIDKGAIDVQSRPKADVMNGPAVKDIVVQMKVNTEATILATFTMQTTAVGSANQSATAIGSFDVHRLLVQARPIGVF